MYDYSLRQRGGGIDCAEYGPGDHTNPPHPHHAPFNKSKLGSIKCNNLLNTHTKLSLLTAIQMYLM